MAIAERNHRAPSAPPAPSGAQTLGVVALIWMLAAALVLTVASDTRVGPVVLKLTATHGVHLGDLYAMFGVTALAVLGTVWVLTDHRTRQRRHDRWRRRSDTTAWPRGRHRKK